MISSLLIRSILIRKLCRREYGITNRVFMFIVEINQSSYYRSVNSDEFFRKCVTNYGKIQNAK